MASEYMCYDTRSAFSIEKRDPASGCIYVSAIVDECARARSQAPWCSLFPCLCQSVWRALCIGTTPLPYLDSTALSCSLLFHHQRHTSNSLSLLDGTILIHSHHPLQHTTRSAQSGNPSLRPRCWCACAPLAGDGEVGRPRHRGALSFIRQLLWYLAILGECKNVLYIDLIAAISPIPSHRSSRPPPGLGGFPARHHHHLTTSHLSCMPYYHCDRIYGPFADFFRSSPKGTLSAPLPVRLACPLRRRASVVLLDGNL